MHQERSSRWPVGVVLDAQVALPGTRAPGRRGARIAVAQLDEDVITLAAAAAQPVLERVVQDRSGSSHPRPVALVLATTSGPFAEGGNAQVLAEVLDLAGDDLLVVEHGGSSAAGGTALVTAAALATSGGGPVLVVAADVRRDPAGRPLGDAAVALLVGAAGSDAAGSDAAGSDAAGSDAAEAQVVARVALAAAASDVVRDAWRLRGEGSTTTADSSFTRVAAATPAARPGVPQRVASTASGPPVDRVGLAGCAAFPLSLLLALDAGDGDAVVSASGVTHRFAVVAGPRAGAVAAAARAAVAAGRDGPAPAASEVEGFDPYASQPRAWRDRAQDLRLAGQRDPSSGEVLYPPVPAAAADGLLPHRLARTGRVLTCTRDHIFPQGAPVGMAVVELDGGGRFYGQVVDGLTVSIGDRVSLVLRRLHDGGGLPQWFYKVQPDDPDARAAGSAADAAPTDAAAAAVSTA